MASELGKLVEMMFTIPGMSNKVKVDLKSMTLKQVLVLSHVIERGIANDGSTSVLLSSLPKAEIEELRQFSEEMLEKAGLWELNEKFKSMGAK